MGEVWQAGEAGGKGVGERAEHGRGAALGRARQEGCKQIDHGDAKARFALEHERDTRETDARCKRTQDGHEADTPVPYRTVPY